MNKKQLIGDAKNLYISARGYDRDGLPTDWFFDQLADLCEKYHQEKLKEIEEAKNQAYWERNQLVCALSKIWPSHIEMHPKEDKDWEDDWRTIIFIESPVGQLSWHIHDSEVDQFTHLNIYDNVNTWDGHSTEEKYKRLKSLDTINTNIEKGG